MMITTERQPGVLLWTFSSSLLSVASASWKVRICGNILQLLLNYVCCFEHVKCVEEYSRYKCFNEMNVVASSKGYRNDMKKETTRGWVTSALQIFRLKKAIAIAVGAEANHLLQQIIHFPVVLLWLRVVNVWAWFKHLVEIASLECLILSKYAWMTLSFMKKGWHEK